EDTKNEKRWPRRMGDHIGRAREERCRKHRDRIGSWIKEACAQLWGWAARQKCAAVDYDDSERSFFPQFPWEQLRERLKIKCGDMGLTFRHTASGEVADKSPESAREAEV